MTKKFNNLSIKQWPEGERLREKLIQFGAERLTNAELLAILLRIGNEGASAIDMGRELVAKLGGLLGVDRAHAVNIMQIKGLGLAKTAQLKAAIEIGKRVRRLDVKPASFDSAGAIARYRYPKFESKWYPPGGCSQRCLLQSEPEIGTHRHGDKRRRNLPDPSENVRSHCRF